MHILACLPSSPHINSPVISTDFALTMGFLYSFGLMQRTKKGWHTLSVRISNSRERLNWLLRVGERFLVSAPWTPGNTHTQRYTKKESQEWWKAHQEDLFNPFLTSDSLCPSLSSFTRTPFLVLKSSFFLNRKQFDFRRLFRLFVYFRVTDNKRGQGENFNSENE